MQVMIRWRVKPTEVKRELELLAAVYAEMRSARPDGLVYNTFQLEDEVTFVAFTWMENGLCAADPEGVTAVPTLDDRCDQPPVVTTLHAVGSYQTP